MRNQILAAILLGTVVTFGAERQRGGKRSLIDSDPAVIYVADILPNVEKVELSVTQPAQVYTSKNGGRKLGVIKGGKVKLIGFDNRAVKVQGQGQTGWIKPSLLKAGKGNIQELLKTVYSREIEVRRLIGLGEIALGMSRDEVCRVLGEPTKKTVRQTKEGMSGTLEFIEYEEVKHYQQIYDRFSGGIFRQYSHTTLEEKAKTVVDFEEGVASAIETSEQENGGDVKIVVRPVVWFW